MPLKMLFNAIFTAVGGTAYHAVIKTFKMFLLKNRIRCSAARRRFLYMEIIPRQAGNYNVVQKFHIHSSGFAASSCTVLKNSEAW